MEHLVRWKLNDYLKAHRITPYQLSLKTKGRLSRTGVYRLTSPELTAIRFDTLATLVPALEELTGAPVSVGDLLEVAPEGAAPELSASGLPYTGDPETDEVLDDPEMVERILAWNRQFEGLSEAEIDAKFDEMRSSGELKTIDEVSRELGISD